MSTALEGLKAYASSRIVSGEDPLKVFTEFSGVGRKTALRWLAGKQFPSGDRWFVVWSWLILVGFEFEEKPKEDWQIRLVQLIGFKIITPTAIAVSLGVQIKTIRRYLTGAITPPPAKLEMIRVLILDKYERIAEKAYAFRSCLPVKDESMEKIKLASRPVNGVLTNNQIIEAAAHQILGLLPLLENLDSERFSDSERQNLRNRAVGDGIFRLSNLASRLCSQTARREIPIQEAKGGK